MPAVLGHGPLTAEYRDRPAVIKIGPHQVTSRAILAPMAGVTDRPFRRMCRQLGAGLVVSEMVTIVTSLWHSRKSRQRLDHRGDPGPHSMQIAGGVVLMIVVAARRYRDNGAEIID